MVSLVFYNYIGNTVKKMNRTLQATTLDM